MMGGQHEAAPTIGGRITQARLTLGARRGKAVTQAWLAGRLGVTPGTVSQWESGTTRPDAYETVPALARALEVSAGWLTWGNDTAPTEAGAVDIVDEDRDRPLTEAAIERARRAVAAKQDAAKATPRKRKGAS